MVDFSAIRPSQPSRPVFERARVAEGPARASEPDGAAPQDKVTLSPEAQRAQEAGGEKQGDQGGKVGADGQQKGDVPGDGKSKAEGPKVGRAPLTADQQREVTWLQQRDVHVRQHEAAHQAAGGSLTGGASFSYQVGPDGRSYAVGGEVPVRLESGRTPDETISNARQARRAALAPSDPSSADLAVAAAATELEQSAQARKAQLAAKAYGKQSGAGKAKGDDAGKADAASQQGSLETSDEDVPAGATRVAA